MNKKKLARCPCGRIPNNIRVTSDGSFKWAMAYPDCCADWNVEFRRAYLKIEDPKLAELARAAWNDAPRGGVKK